MSFVTVRFADNQSQIFNHNCKNGVLLGHIKQRCGLKPDANIDLSDERGSVKQLHYNLDDYGTDYLRDRETLVLIKVNRLLSEEDIALTEDDVTYTPLLESLVEDTQFLNQLNPSHNKNGKKRNSQKLGSAARHSRKEKAKRQ